jgi:hypothetical protein
MIFYITFVKSFYAITLNYNYCYVVTNAYLQYYSFLLIIILYIFLIIFESIDEKRFFKFKNIPMITFQGYVYSNLTLPTIRVISRFFNLNKKYKNRLMHYLFYKDGYDYFFFFVYF